MAILTVTDGNSSVNTIQERVAGTPTVGVDLNVSGGNGNYTFSISEQPVLGAFTIDSDGVITVADGTLIDFESAVNGQITLTIHVEDNAAPTPNFADVQVVINVTNLSGNLVNGTNAGEVIDGVPTTPGLQTTEEEDQINGQGGDDTILALGGNDIIDGGSGKDDIDGGAGNDLIKGGSDDDIIVGGLGDDDIDGGSGVDDMDGGAGIDTLRYTSATNGVQINLKTSVTGGDAAGDLIANFENLIGSGKVDELTGDDGDNVIEGAGGADKLDGGDNDIDISLGDTLSYRNSGAGVTVTLGKATDFDLTVETIGKGGDAEGDQIKNFENILGSALVDILTGNNFDNVIEGGAGADILDGGSGRDTLFYVGSTKAVTITLGAAGKQAIGSGGDALGDKFSNFESVLGSSFNDALNGNELSNDLVGGQGNDTINGNAGDDFLFGDDLPFPSNTGLGGNDIINGGDGDDWIDGGVGSDQINGGNGIDTLSYEFSSKAVTVTLGTKGALAQMQGGEAAGDKVQFMENVVGSANADKITGNDLDNIIEGRGGADILDGSGGSNDTVSYADAPDTGLDLDGVTIDLADQDGVLAQVGDSDENGDILKNFENIIGSAFDDDLSGNGVTNVIEGGAGEDIMFGGGGDDILSYAGYENLVNDVGVTVALNNSNEAVIVANGSDADGDVATSFEGLRGSNHDDVLTGNDGKNVIQGLAGDDFITGGQGEDTLDGGADFDIVSFADSGSGVTVTLGAPNAVTIVAGGTVGLDKIVNFEGIEGSDFADTLTGNALDNTFDGNAGQDLINGGAGNDTVDFSWAASGIIVTLGASGAQTTVSGGDTDKISLIENIIGTGFDDEITGNALINVLKGGAGADKITGGAGADTIDGGAGDDVIVIAGTDAQADVIVGGTETDKILVTGITALTLENFSASAASIETWQGNGLAVLGTTKNNIFDFSGLTTLTGILFVDGGAGNDTIKGHAAGVLGMDLRGGLGDDTLIGAGQADKLDGGDGEDSLEGGAGNDTLKGGVGSDTIFGDAGNDTITGGAGNDFMDGGEDDDTYIVSGLDGQFDIVQDTGVGVGNIDKIEVQGTLAVTLDVFDAGAAGIEQWKGNNTAVLGNAGENRLDFSGITATGITFIDGGAGDDFLTAADSGSDLRGALGDDTLTGGAGEDTFNGGIGNDVIDGDAGNDTIIFTGVESQFDVVQGGANTDKIQVIGTVAVTLDKFDSTTNGIEEWFGAIGSTQGVVGNANDNILNFVGLTNVQNLPFIDGGAGDDVITGDHSGRDLRGGTGDDTITGGDGGDIINGGIGEDDIDGGDGNDKIQINGAEAEFDVIDGGADNDTVVALGAVAVTLSAFNATVSGIENWTGNKQAIQGNANDNVLDFSGITGNFTDVPFINGAAGNDTITGTIYADDIRGGIGKDTLHGGLGSDKLDGGDGIDTLNGGDDGDTLIGGLGNDILNGDAGDDTLNGGAGTDTYNAGLGIDTFQITGLEAQFDVFNGNGSTTIAALGAIAVTLNAFNATGSQLSTWSGNGKGVLGDATDNTLDFSGLAVVSNMGIIDGGAGIDTITGTDFFDDIRGGTGNDILVGGEGEDTLNGGLGNDTLQGGLGNDKFVVSGAEGQFDTILLDAGGTDTISFVGATITLDGFNATASGIEVWDGKSAAIVGNAGANTFDLSGLTSVSLYKSIDGGAGNDTITGVNLADVADDLRGNTGNDTLEGGRGNDKLTGGSGNDTFIFETTDFGKDTIVDFSTGFDVLSFDGLFADDDAVFEAATQVGTSVVIAWDDQNTITLQNYTLAQLETLVDTNFILTT